MSGGGGVGQLVREPIPQALSTGASWGSNIGKGLEESCSPYRLCIVFGADLNTPNANNWNCLPDIWGATKSFNLASIAPNHEVVVAILYGSNIWSQTPVNHQWYRDRDNKPLFGVNYTIPNPASYGYDYWLWYYVYSYIGYVSWEIWENGAHHVNIEADWYNTRINFEVSGIPPHGYETFTQEIELEPGDNVFDVFLQPTW